MMQAVAESGAARSGAAAIHMNIFGLHPGVKFGTKEQKHRMLPPLIRGEHKACFAVTEPDAGLNTTALKTWAEKRGNRYVVTGQKIWISTAQVADKVLLLARTTRREDVERKTGGLSPDRKSVVEGKRGSVRVDLGGRRIIKKKKQVRR